MSTGSPPPDESARTIAQRLISIRRSAGGNESAAHAHATACDDLYRDLARWVGPDGCHALFTRALTLARAEHPALEPIQLQADSAPYIDGVTEAITAQGDAATADALESMLTRVITLLARLIGDHMTMRLIDQGLAQAERRDAAGDTRREEP